MSTSSTVYSISTDANINNMTNPSNATSDTNEYNVTSYHLFMTRFIVQRILVPIVVSGGVVGNIFNIIVLRNPKMQSSTNTYLTALAVCDTMYLVFSLTLSFIHCSNTEQDQSSFYYIPYGRVLSDWFGNTAVFLTVSFTLERYIGVCHPMKGKAWCTVKKAKVTSFIALLLCLVNTIPEMFELEIISKYTLNNDSSVTRHVYQCRYTEFAETESYQIGYYWWYVALFTIAPLCLLFIFNTLLIRSVWRANRNRKLLSNSQVLGNNQKQSLEQQKVTTMLITVVLVFLFCQSPQAMLLIYQSYLKSHDIPYSAHLLKIGGNICNLLVQINASVNLLLYSYFSSKFRRTLQNLFFRRKRARSHSNTTSSVRSCLTRTSSGNTPASRLSDRSHAAVVNVGHFKK